MVKVARVGELRAGQQFWLSRAGEDACCVRLSEQGQAGSSTGRWILAALGAGSSSLLLLWACWIQSPWLLHPEVFLLSSPGHRGIPNISSGGCFCAGRAGALGWELGDPGSGPG